MCAYYSAPRVVTEMFNVDDYTYNNDQYITLFEANQRYALKSGDIVIGGIVFNGTNTYSQLQEYYNDCKIHNKALKLYDAGGLLKCSIDSSGIVFTGNINGVTATTFSYLDATSSIQTQLDSVVAVNNTQNTNISTLQTQVSDIVTVNNTQNTNISTLQTKTTQQSYSVAGTAFSGDVSVNGTIDVLGISYPDSTSQTTASDAFLDTANTWTASNTYNKVIQQTLPNCTDCTAFGQNAYSDTVAGLDCCAFGTSTMPNATGNTNCAFGARALFSLTLGNANCAFGKEALYNCTTGGTNMAIGSSALCTG